MVWQIFVMTDTTNKLQVIVSEDCLVSELLKKIKEHPHTPRGTSYRFHTSIGDSYADDEDIGDLRLSDIQLMNKSTIHLSVGLAGGVWPSLEELERFPRNPRPSERIQITVSSLHPDIVGLDDESPRVIMPCGHAIAPLSLAGHCWQELKNNKPEICCPECKSPWPFLLIREAACLSDNETVEFEQKLLMNRQNAEIKQCPKCSISCHRQKDTDKRVKCLNCKSKGKANYKFCWRCLGEWKNRGRYTCGNSKCGDNKELFRILEQGGIINLLGEQCPSLRACPMCTLIIEHTTGCKHMTCTRCHYEFCFMCLKTHTWFLESSKTCEVAPRQTLGIAESKCVIS